MRPALLLFCGSRPGLDARQGQLADAVGRMTARMDITLVFGGGAVGLMGIAARAALAEGGRVTGVIPRALMTAEIAQPGLTEMHVVDTLHERKALMHRLSDAVIALPGSIGTLDELFESLTWRELGLHDKPIWLLSENGFWNPLIDLLQHIAAQGFAPPDLGRLLEPLDGLVALATRLEKLSQLRP